jgi:hypothetical protein
VGGPDVRVLSFRRSDCLGRVRGLNDEPGAFFRGECERRLYRIIWRIDGGIQPDGGVSDLVGYVFSSRVTERRGFAGSVLSPVRTWPAGFSVPIAVFMAGVSIPAAFMKLLPKWIVIFGLFVTGIGALSWFSWVFPKLCFLIPLTTFASILWMIAAGFTLPNSMDRPSQ